MCFPKKQGEKLKKEAGHVEYDIELFMGFEEDLY
jgi:hypothetical protein